MIKNRPEVLKGTTEKTKTGCGSLYLTVNEDEQGSPCEVRLQLGKSGSCVRSMLEVIGILLSIIFQHVEKVVAVDALKKHLRGVSCGREFRVNDKRYSSCLDKIAQRVLIEYKEEIE